MTTFQHLDVTASGAVAGEDAMELSTEFDRRYLGDEDIDIDLGPEGRSPYVQEDEYMLEDANSIEDRPVYGSQAEANDDEMTDEVVVPGTAPDGHEQDNNIQFEEQDEFDILVDDEDLHDVDDTMAIPDGIAPQLTSYPHSSEPSPEDQSRGIFASQFAPNINPELEHGMLYNSEQIAQDKTTLNPFSISGTIHHPGDSIGSTAHEDDASILNARFIQRKTDNQPVNDEEVENADKLVSLNADIEPKTGVEGDVSTQAENQERVNESGFDLEGMGSVANQSGSPTQEREQEDNTLSRATNENRLGNPTESGHSVKVESSAQEITHHDAHQDGSVTSVQDRTASDDSNQDKVNEGEGGISVRHRASLHPVVVLYQQSEIFLFPPHDNDEQYAQTYFLEDESLANQNVKVLLEALRLVLADSINEYDELEINFVSLGLDICEVRIVLLCLVGSPRTLTLLQTSIASCNASLSQIVDIYLQLQHNDGTEHPDALQMTLSTKSSFSNRLDYLYSAIAGGIGFVDIATWEKAKEIDRPTEQSEGHDGISREIPESFPTEAEKPTGKEEQKNEGQDGTEEFPNSLLMPNERRGPEESTQTAALESVELQQQAKEERDLHKGSKSNPEPRDSNTSSEQEHDQIATVNPSADHSNSRTGNVWVPEAGSLPHHTAEQTPNEEQDEGLRASSTTSSTLHGDESDIAGGGLYGQPPDNGMPNNDHNNFDRAAGATDDDRWSIVDAVEDEASKELYDGNHGDDFDVGPEDDATTFDEGTDHLPIELNTNGSEQGVEGKYAGSVDTTQLAISKQESGGSSEIDNDEITYDEEDEFEEKGDAEDASTRNSILSTEEHDSEDGLEQSDDSVARCDSLKRLRPGEDDELSSTYNKQGKPSSKRI